MRREYAADTLKWNLTDLLTKEKDRATLDFLCECVDFLLKQPKPDAETGLMPCGCGCGASVAYFGGDYGEQEIFQVTSECGLGTGFEYTEDAVINTWNEAMGWLPPLLEANE